MSSTLAEEISISRKVGRHPKIASPMKFMLPIGRAHHLVVMDQILPVYKETSVVIGLHARVFKTIQRSCKEKVQLDDTLHNVDVNYTFYKICFSKLILHQHIQLR